VAPSAQGRGIAQKFIEYAEKVARERGYSYVRVDTNSMNETMQRLFTRCGFQFIQDISLKNKPGLLFKLYEKKLV
jgi:ribosomal protein S18 acetylase RimI-like enzyme